MPSMTASKPDSFEGTKRGFAHRCPFCGQEDALRVSLASTSVLDCSECGDEITDGDVRRIIGQWQTVLAWLETAPARIG